MQQREHLPIDGPHAFGRAHRRASLPPRIRAPPLPAANHGRIRWLRNGLELDHLRSGKCDAQHLGSEVHEHCCIAVLGADHGTEAVPIMADSIADGVVRHRSDCWWLVEGTSWEGPRGAGAARSHASSVRPLGRVGAPLPEVAGRTSADFPTLSLAAPPTHPDRRADAHEGLALVFG